MPRRDPWILSAHARSVNPMELKWCPSVRSLVGSSPDLPYCVLLPIRCKRWTCPYCRVCNEILLKEKVRSGHPNRMLTLTAPPSPGDTPKTMHDRLRPAISRLYCYLRRRTGFFESATFLELHRSGFPHWHALCRSPYLPIEDVRTIWNRLTAAKIVDLRRIKDPAVAGRYVTKYVTKQLSSLVQNRIGRVVCFTRHYLPVKTPNAKPPLRWSLLKSHPLEVGDQLGPGWSKSWEGRTCLLTPPPGTPPSWIHVVSDER